VVHLLPGFWLKYLVSARSFPLGFFGFFNIAAPDSSLYLSSQLSPHVVKAIFSGSINKPYITFYRLCIEGIP